MYTDGEDRQSVVMLFQLTSGWTAAMRGNAPPPDERFEENPIPDERLDAITSKILPSIAQRTTNAIYDPGL